MGKKPTPERWKVYHCQYGCGETRRSQYEMESHEEVCHKNLNRRGT